MTGSRALLASAGAACLLAACASPRIGAQIVDQNGKGVAGASVATEPPTDFKYSPKDGHVHITEMALQGGRTGPIPNGTYTLTAKKTGCEQVKPVRFVVDGGAVQLGKVRLQCRQKKSIGGGGMEGPVKMPKDKPVLDPPYRDE